jgi:hypothetical protein
MRVRFRVQPTGGEVQLRGCEFFRDNLATSPHSTSGYAVSARYRRRFCQLSRGTEISVAPGVE